MKTVSEYREFIINHTSTINRLTTDISTTRTTLDDASTLLENYYTARDIVASTGVIAQQNATSVIEELTTKALQTVFDNTYEFKIESKVNRNKVEASIKVLVNKQERTPKLGIGGSVVDVISFALRIIAWALDCKKRSNTIILDEPARCVSKDKIHLFGEMMKHMSDLLRIQFVGVTHDDVLSGCANTRYEVTKVNEISRVR